ncbi:MAG: hypothetical protein QOG63_244 [Thermoleophilaceae bacterium]|nr:hypothetical protein [Thermoleophilaceae bacterium]
MIKPRATHTAAAAAAACLVALTSASEAIAAHKTEVLRVFSKQTSFVYTNADGTVARVPPSEPKPGDSFDATANDYVGNHRHHAKHWTSSQHLHCVVGSDSMPSCQAQVAVGGSLLIYDGFKLALGTGRYLGATGTVSSKEVRGGEDVVARTHLR